MAAAPEGGGAPQAAPELAAPRRCRLDQRLVGLGLAPSRTQAQALILAGRVVGAHGSRLDKPGMQVAAGAELRLSGAAPPFVSRGGLKLAAALDRFDLAVEGRRCLDVGASTGGFTDCLLQRGASHVDAVDVGYGQLAWRLRCDPRVQVLERCNVRHLAPGALGPGITLAVIDVSFISLRLVLPAVLRHLAPEAAVVALVKPQFEVGPSRVGKGGIVRDPAARAACLADIVACAAELGLEALTTMESPVIGAKGNHEFLLGARRR